MPRSCAGSWDAALLFLRHRVPTLDKALAISTWTMCTAQGGSPPSSSAATVAGASTTVPTVKMPVLSAQVAWLFLPKYRDASKQWPLLAAIRYMLETCSKIVGFVAPTTEDHPAETHKLSITCVTDRVAPPSPALAEILAVLLHPQSPHLLLSLPPLQMLPPRPQSLSQHPFLQVGLNLSWFFWTLLLAVPVGGSEGGVWSSPWESRARETHSLIKPRVAVLVA